MLRRSMIRVTVVVAALSMPVFATAQVSPIGLSALKMIQFDAPAPSARGLALAGTGIGMPDDATAAMTNPAALRFLVRGEAIGSFGWHQPSFDMISNRSLPPRFSAADLTFEPLRRGAEDLSFGVAYPTRRFAAAGFVRTLSKSLWGTEGTELLNGPLGYSYGKSYWKQFGFATSVSLSVSVLKT